MDGTFACPDCENEIHLEGLSPGRQVRCAWCEAWVEVPFIPRSPLALRRRFSSRRNRSWRTWTWTALGIATVMIGVIGTGRALERRACEQTEEALNSHISAAARLEHTGQLDEALLEYDQALTVGAANDPEQRDRLKELQGKRDRVLRRSTESRLAAIPTCSPEKAVADLLSLRTEVRKEPTLSDLEETIDAHLERSQCLWAESDVVAAQRAFDSGRMTLAFDRCERLTRTADALTDKESRWRLRAQAETLVREIISRQGVIVEPTHGNFTLGTPATYDNLFRPLVDDLLSRRGYAMRRPSSEWNSLWDSLAPYRLKIEVLERQDGNYLHSENRLSGIEAMIILTRGGQAIWRGGPAIGRSQSPLSKLAAYQASHFAVGKRRSDAERVLYDDAHAAFVDKFSILLRGLPACTTSPALVKIP